MAEQHSNDHPGANAIPQEELKRTHYPCTYEHCDYSFSRNADLRGHMLMHTVDRPFICRGCCKSIKSLAEFNQHKESNREYFITCHLCNYRFDNCSSLGLHLDDHNGEEAYKCRVCHQFFSKFCSLLAHVQQHKNITPNIKLICPFCEKEYATSYGIRNHILAMAEQQWNDYSSANAISSVEVKRDVSRFSWEQKTALLLSADLSRGSSDISCTKLDFAY